MNIVTEERSTPTTPTRGRHRIYDRNMSEQSPVSGGSRPRSLIGQRPLPGPPSPAAYSPYSSRRNLLLESPLDSPGASVPLRRLSPERIASPSPSPVRSRLSADRLSARTLPSQSQPPVYAMPSMYPLDSDQTFINIAPTPTIPHEFDDDGQSTLHEKLDYFGYNADDGDEVGAEDTRHFGPAPAKAQPRRNKERVKRQVELVRGNLVLDCPIPSKLSSFLSKRDAEEFTHMRYTAATCDPNDFQSDGYVLRPAIESRETQLFIGITMYNEDEVLFTRTIHSVMKNIQYLCSRTKSRVWGKEGWKKVVVCIIADGRHKVNPRVLDVLAAMGVYQSGIAKNFVNGKEVTAHIYEHTTQVSIDTDLKFQGAERGLVPVQTVFCLKEKNARKLNSHRWFFNGFAPLLQPNVCVLVDVGTRPGTSSIYHLWKTFDIHSNVGGACGEVKAMKGRAWKGLLNPLVAAQNFEYKMSNILDKPLESVLGYITVLPGAFSAYRYLALHSDDPTSGPLNVYFKGEKLHGPGNPDVFTANMYLAEDRILCWELVAKRGEKWVLKYVRAATGETDVPDAVAELVSQRRRWLNGAFFAAVYAQTHFRQIWQTDHSIQRKIVLHLEFIYQFINLALSFFSLANFFLAFYFVCGGLSVETGISPFGTSGWGERIFTIVRYFCIILIMSQFILSMGNRPQGSRVLFIGSMVGFAFIMIYTMFCAIYQTVVALQESLLDHTYEAFNTMTIASILVALVSTFGVYTLASILYLDPWHMATCFLQYLLLLPSWIATLQVYAFCNTYG